MNNVLSSNRTIIKVHTFSSIIENTCTFHIQIDIFKKILVLDAWGKIPEGFLGGNIMFIGSYSACLEVNVLPHKHNGTDIEGFQ
jgi:hypothetical protein